jgi:hypothetical protein
MAWATTLHEAAILNVMRGTTLTAFTPYVGLFTAAPTDAGGGTECSGGNYARQSITFGAPSGTPNNVANSGIITFGTVTWTGTVVAWGIFDALTIGNLRYWLAVTGQAVASGNIVQFNSGVLVVQVD